ncbi:hypothetical protein HanXRQr2_Chr02g0049611 [Helianthus annuus]|uniref:Uncharacterized protein n=1 Tax=Helianthus annuus TaxID=4232 RepID=A0A9K3JL84_HELAN|nr:hypothetical protein HanXRQr2_Chr02g0049611 [Helianthus annuus]KAJ0950507.1 hypothetical protein HanPSC8_Chr02g0049051 [Helianthus annuus]
MNVCWLEFMLKLVMVEDDYVNWLNSCIKSLYNVFIMLYAHQAFDEMLESLANAHIHSRMCSFNEVHVLCKNL